MLTGERKRSNHHKQTTGHYLATVICVAGLTACAHVPKHHAGKSTPQQTTQSTTTGNEPLKLELTVSEQIAPQLTAGKETEPTATIDPLLDGISGHDLKQAMRMAKSNYRRSWKTVEERSRFVRDRLLEALKQLDAPESLQLIPVVESTYNPYAISHTGAIGLWQLMPSTARYLGVHAGTQLDGRRDIATSTAVAVRYLKRLHDRFGNWPLALAAYNIGPNALARKLKRHPWHLADGLERMPVPSHARRYVQHIIGLISLWQEHHFTFPEPIQTRAVALRSPVDIHRLAKLGGMAKNDIFRLNPCLNHAQYLKQEITIHVPSSHYQMILAKMAEAGPQYVNITVKKGDSLWSIARAHQISVGRLKALNSRLGRYLHIGQTLKVPAVRLAGANGLSNPLIPTKRRIRYRVRSGDSLWRIANRFGTTPKAIARYNRISMNRTIRVGDTLWVYGKERSS